MTTEHCVIHCIIKRTHYQYQLDTINKTNLNFLRSQLSVDAIIYFIGWVTNNSDIAIQCNALGCSRVIFLSHTIDFLHYLRYFVNVIFLFQRAKKGTVMCMFVTTMMKYVTWHQTLKWVNRVAFKRRHRIHTNCKVVISVGPQGARSSAGTMLL